MPQFESKLFRCNSKTALRRLERSQRRLRRHLTGGISVIYKSALFGMSLRSYMRRLRDASEMHPCRLGMLLLTNAQVLKLRKTFANNSTANIALLKTQLHKIGQSGGFLVRLLELLLKTGLPLMKNVLKPLAKSVLIPLGLTAAASATNCSCS